VPAVPTAFVGAADDRNLRDIIEGAGWQEAVVKPAVSLNAYDTWRVPVPAAAEDEERFVQLRSRGDVLVQRFLPEITGSGEWSLIFFGRYYSHAVRKLPRHGDFRVQTEHGGSVQVDTPPPVVIEAAARALAALPVEPVYCRIDGVVADGTFMIMEAECIDPVLYFAEHPPAAGMFADAVMRHTCGPGTHSAD
jgi:glutathione synthase/RimK-type ligase-like ATP-grasp enzyme